MRHPRSDVPDAVVVGSGPNGLAAAITLARAGHEVRVVEAAEEPGGGVRSAGLTLPGFVHDVCSAVYPYGRTSPFFERVDLAAHGLRWIEPQVPLAHPLDDGRAILVHRSVEATARDLGGDGAAYRRLIGPLVRDLGSLLSDVLAPFHVPAAPRRAARLAWFGFHALQPAALLARRFEDGAARALVAGVAAHAILPLSEPVSGAAALLLLATAHHDGWPFPEGGAGRLAAALVAELSSAGGSIQTGHLVARLEDLPRARVAVFDTAPRTLAAVAGRRLPPGYRNDLARFRYGPAVFKLDLALDGPIPWRAPEVALAGTVHLGGSFEEIARSEADAAAGRISDRPFVLLAQPSAFDPTRAPAGRAVAWAYCHVPHGSTADMTEPILRQVERFAPGFRDRILAVRAMDPAAVEAHNPNNVGGDVSGGRMDLRQLFTRPAIRTDPYSTPDPRLFLCSASTPPGGGVHGMCGVHAAHSVLRRLHDREDR